MITQTLDLNLIPGRVLPMVNVSQYDKDSRTLEFTIYNGDQSFDLTGLSAYIQGLKPDGHGFNYSATVSSTKITADVTEQMTACAGRVMCEVVIMSGTDRIGTGNFILNVEKAAMPDNADMSASEYSYIQELIEDAQAAQTAAEESAEDAEAWAVGERGGVPVTSGDDTYQNNSKYYAQQAQIYAQGALKYKGSVLFANIPTTGMTEGDMYNIEDDFTTDNRFQEGAGIDVAAGSNIAWNANSKWDVLTVVAPGVASFNGRTGAVTPASGDYDITEISATGGSEGQIPMVDSNGDLTLTDLPDTDIKSIEDYALSELTVPGSCLLTTHYGMSVQNGTPTPSSPVAIENAKANYRDCGKNLIPYPYYETTHTDHVVVWTDNGDGTVTANGTASGDSTFILTDRNNSNYKLSVGEYVLTGCPANGGTNKYQIYATYEDGNGVVKNLGYDIGSGKQISITQAMLTDNPNLTIGIVIKVSNGTGVTDLTFKPMLRLASVTDSTYEQYNGEEVNTNLTLRAIEVTSSAPYNLVKDGKYYIADTLDKIDGGYQITRRVHEFECDGTESWNFNQTEGYQRFDIRYDTVLHQPSELVSAGASEKSSHFVQKTGNIGTWGKFYVNASGFLVVHDNDLVMASLADFKTWLGTNKPKFMYAIEPTTEPVSSENAKKLLSLKSHETSTYISQTEDTEGVMVIEYPTSELTSKALTGYVKAEKNGILLDEFLCGQTTAGTYSVSATVDANEKVTYAWT